MDRRTKNVFKEAKLFNKVIDVFLWITIDFYESISEYSSCFNYYGYNHYVQFSQVFNTKKYLIFSLIYLKKMQTKDKKQN